KNGRDKDDEDLGGVNYPIPSDWSWMSIEEVCELISDCPHSTPKYIEEGQYPAIRSSDIELGKVDIINAKRVSEQDYLDRTKRIEPQKGDIIYCREGSGDVGKAVGKAGLLLDDKVCLAQRVVLLRPNIEQVLPTYFVYALNSPIMLKQVSLNISQTTSPRINISTLRKLSLPIAPPEIQQNIVNIIEKCLDIEQQANNFYKLDGNLDALRQSILAKAFRGELGTNDPSEENAIELLKEVLQEKVK
ncbi:restriction endonuclease subunit S, partial [Bacillus sp. 445_BSPC]